MQILRNKEPRADNVLGENTQTRRSTKFRADHYFFPPVTLQRAQKGADAHDNAQAEGRQTSRLQERSPQGPKRDMPNIHAK
jgi:hypothetical protein